MKPIKISFLYFLIAFFTINFCVFAQSKVDSLKYYSDLALKPQNANDLTKTYSYFDKNYYKSLDNNDILSATYSLYYKASVLFKNGDYDTSEETAVKALTHLDEVKSSPYIDSLKLSLYNLLGLLYTEQKNKPKAIELYNNALTRAKKTLDSITLYNNISLVHKNFNDYDNAKKEIVKAYELIPRTSDKLIKALVLDNYGVLESEFDKTKGLSLMNKALELRKSIKDTSTIYTSYNHLAKYYDRIENKSLAKEYGLKALGIAKKINSQSYLEDALGLLVELSDDPYAREYKKLLDSIDFNKANEENKFAFMEYEYSEYKRKATESELEKQREQNMKLLYLIIAIIITLSFVFIYYMQKSKHKKEKLQQVHDTESRISKKVHDELANDMSDLMNFVENDIEVTEVKKSLLLDNIEDIYLRTRDISTETGSIDLVNFSDSIKHLLMQHNKQDTKVITNNVNTIDWQNIEEHKKVVIYRCLQELLVNMKKHSKAKVVSVVFKNHIRKNEIRYVDDGLGFSIDETKLNGLSNVESRIKGIGGSFNFTTSKGNGFKATIKFNS